MEKKINVPGMRSGAKWFEPLLRLVREEKIESEWVLVTTAGRTAAYQNARDIVVAQRLVEEMGAEKLLSFEFGATMTERVGEVFVRKSRKRFGEVKS